MKIKIGLLRVLTLKDGKPDHFHHENVIESNFPDLKVVSRSIEDQYEGIYDEETEKKAIPKIIELGKKMGKEDIEALIVDCAADPGVGELRKIVKIPVIGAGSSSASLALAYGSRIATMGIRGDAPKIMKKVLGRHLVCAVKPGGVKTALDLMTEEGKKNSIIAVTDLYKENIDVIALACTGYAALGIDSELEKAAGVPVVNALVAAGLFAWYRTMKKNSSVKYFQ
ncbi:hypothetical protein AMJ80_10435 [bacterium SM23_31]|nr:MAG: hypothetical protein AMJ80_10435 [bacterium SM23_31]